MTTELAAKLDSALQKGGWNTEEVWGLCRVCEDDRTELLKLFREVLYERAEIKRDKSRVKLDARPFVPDGYLLASHKTYPRTLIWNPRAIGFYYPDTKIGDLELASSVGANVTPLNANVLDFLLAYPHLVPGEWKSCGPLFFWGTIYCDAYAMRPHVRKLSWDVNNNKWASHMYELLKSTSLCRPIAILKEE